MAPSPFFPALAYLAARTHLLPFRFHCFCTSKQPIREKNIDAYSPGQSGFPCNWEDAIPGAFKETAVSSGWASGSPVFLN